MQGESPFRTPRHASTLANQRYGPPIEFCSEFSDDEGSPRRARRLIDAALHEVGFRGDAALVQLLASELVTNAIIHARPPFALRLDVTDVRARVDVEDGDAEHLPVRRDADPTDLAPGGRGLMLVDELADEWGCEVPGGDRKSVWFCVGVAGSP